MISGGQIGWPVRTLIQMECQSIDTHDVEACKQEVTKKLERELENICRSSFRLSIPLQKECTATLKQKIWVNPADLKRQLKAKIAAAADHLPPILQSSFVFVKAQAQPFKPAPPPIHNQPVSPPQSNEDPAHPVVWGETLANVDDNLTGGKFQFTHVNEWWPVAMEVNHWTLEWSYWLQPNADGTYTVFWRMDNKTTDPTSEDRQLVFRLQNGEYPLNLILQVKENQTMQLVLK